MRSCWITGLFLCCWLWMYLPGRAQGTDIVVLTDTDNPLASLPVEGALSAYVDSSQRRSLVAIEQQPFMAVGRMVPNAGYTGATDQACPIWLRWQVQNATRHAIQLYARVNFWCFDSLQLFVTDPATNALLTVSPPLGWRVPVEARPVGDRYYCFPMTIPAGADRIAYLRVFKSRGTQVIPLKLWRRPGYIAYMPREYLFWGGVLLSLLFVTAMSLFFFITTGDSIYWSYLFCLLCLIGFFIINDGFLNQFAFGAQFWLPRQNCYFVFPLLLFYSQLLFIRTFLPLKKTPARWLHRLSSIVLPVGAACAIMLMMERWLTFPYWLEIAFTRLFTVLYWLPMLLIGAFVIVSISRRYHVASGWLYLVAVTPFYLLNFGQVLANFELIPTYGPVVDFRWYAISALFEVLTLTLGLAFRYKHIRDENDKLLKTQREKERTTHASEVQSLAHKNTMLQEKERIARDLHDNVGAQLAFLITTLLHISRRAEQAGAVSEQLAAEGGGAGGLADELRTVVGYARDAIRTLRETIWAINQENFTLAEFDDRLNQYVNRYVQQTNGLEISVRIDGDSGELLTSVQVLNFFRIVQEALSNVIKHAQATEAEVDLQVQANGAFHLTIHDNGRGLRADDKPTDDRHYGIHNMKRRAEELGGRFQIYDRDGTVIDVIRKESDPA